MPHGHFGPRPRHVVALLLLTTVLAIGLRLHGSELLLGGPDPLQIADGDGEYHAHRMLQVVQGQGSLPPATDARIAFPEGWPVCWPPGFDYLLGLVRWASGGWTIPLLLIVLLGGLLPLAAWRVARRAGASAAAALFAALFAALSPILIEYSRIGRLDHHVVEPLVLLLALGSIPMTAEAPPSRRGVAAGLWLGAGLWLWPSALLVAGVVLAGLLLHRLHREGGPGEVRTATNGALAAGLATLPLVALMAQGTAFRLDGPSLSHLSFLMAIAVIGVVALRWGRSRPRILLIYLMGGILWLALNVPAADLALRFGGKQGLWGYVLEQRSLFALPWRFQLLLAGLTPLLLLPAAWIVWRRGQTGGRLLCIWTLLLGPLAVLQLRFLPLLMALAAPLLALAADVIFQWARARWPEKADRGWLLVTILFALAFIPTAPYLNGSQRAYPNKLTRARAELARWLRSAPQDPDRPAVLGSLGLGNYIVHRAQRPVVASVLIDSETLPALRDALRFLTTVMPAEALAIVKRRRVGWVVLGPLPARRHERYLRFLGRPQTDPQRSLAYRLRRGLRVSWLKREGMVGPFVIFQVKK